MRLSEKYAVPADLALLYEFANSIDLRRYVEQGATHEAHDDLATVSELEDWLRARGLLEPGSALDAGEHRKALGLREAVRSFIESQSGDADSPPDPDVAARLTTASADFPLVLDVLGAGKVGLSPRHGARSGLGRVLAELRLLSETDRLERLKMCASDECHWIFYDRSKPGNRRWCSSALCGNRQKTRTYRQKRRGDSAAA